MKFSSFTLKEIKQVLNFNRERNIKNFPSLLQIMIDKKTKLLKMTELYHSMVGFIDQASELMKNKKSPSDIAKIDKLVFDAYQTLTEGNNNE
jgi:flagellin-specific chaperone FliS